ncbi:restriction endonuclease subunit S [Acinetobacter pseudolwoffii]|uniref:restriction endonuclease subunit S n=1 Tax=Acinetobacter pseudolwoffii TaxID=2053287 RepID=UPI003526385E
MAAPKLRFKGFDQDWTGLKIKDLVKSLDAGVSVNSEDVEPKEDEYSVLKTSCISSGYFDENERKRVLQDGEIQRLKEPVLDDSILMSRMNTPLLVGMNAYVFKAPKNTFLPDRLWQLKIDDNKTVTRWLAFYLGSDQGLNQIRDLASGTSNSMKNITKPDVLNLDLFVPSKEEQTKIASFLSTVDEKINQLTQKHALLSQYKQGMMQKLFSQQIRFKADDGSEFGEWEILKFKDVITIKYGKDHKKLEDGDIPVLGTGGIMRYVDSYLYDGESILIGRKGTIDKPQFISGKFWTVDTLFYTEIGEKIQPKFAFQQLLLVNWLNLNEATGVPSLNTTSIGNIELKVPSLKEQTKISNFLSAIDQKIEVVAQQIEQAKTWKKGLLQQMFV